MYRVRLKIADLLYYLAESIEEVYPYGFEFNCDKVWELFDECFLEEELQNYTDSDMYEGYLPHVRPNVLNGIFEYIHELINEILTRLINPEYRRTLPDVVMYLDNGIYELRWRVQ